MIMDTISLHRYEQLKQRILATAEHWQYFTCRMQNINLSYFKKTGNRISETTLKRIYGFAHSKFMPSLLHLIF